MHSLPPMTLEQSAPGPQELGFSHSLTSKHCTKFYEVLVEEEYFV